MDSPKALSFYSYLFYRTLFVAPTTYFYTIPTLDPTKLYWKHWPICCMAEDLHEKAFNNLQTYWSDWSQRSDDQALSYIFVLLKNHFNCNKLIIRIMH